MTNKEQYADLCATHPEMPIFMQSWWMDAVCAGKEWDVILEKDGDTVIAAMPYLKRKKWWMRFIVMPQQTQIGGIWIHPSYLTQAREICTRLADDIKGMKLCYYYQQYPIDSPCPIIMQELGFGIKHRTTYRINNLSDMDAVIDRFSKNKKRQLQKALSLHAERGTNVEEFYRFHTHCMLEQKKRVSYSREFLLVMERKTQRAGQSEIISIKNADGETYAAAFVVWDKNYMYYLIPCYSYAHRDSGASALLVLETIKLAREKGVKFDFEGSNERGIANSYKQFGSEATDYYSVRKFYRKYFALALAWNHIKNLKYRI